MCFSLCFITFVSSSFCFLPSLVFSLGFLLFLVSFVYCLVYLVVVRSREGCAALALFRPRQRIGAYDSRTARRSPPHLCARPSMLERAAPFNLSVRYVWIRYLPTRAHSVVYCRLRKTCVFHNRTYLKYRIRSLVSLTHPPRRHHITSSPIALGYEPETHLHTYLITTYPRIRCVHTRSHSACPFIGLTTRYASSGAGRAWYVAAVHVYITYICTVWYCQRDLVDGVRIQCAYA